jgi:hypothetical protein
VIKGKKKKSALRRKSFTFRGVDFYEDPCKCATVLYAVKSGIGKDPILRPVVIVGDAKLVGQIKNALRKA